MWWLGSTETHGNRVAAYQRGAERTRRTPFILPCKGESSTYGRNDGTGLPHLVLRHRYPATLLYFLSKKKKRNLPLFLFILPYLFLSSPPLGMYGWGRGEGKKETIVVVIFVLVGQMFWSSFLSLFTFCISSFTFHLSLFLSFCFFFEFFSRFNFRPTPSLLCALPHLWRESIYFGILLQTLSTFAPPHALFVAISVFFFFFFFVLYFPPFFKSRSNNSTKSRIRKGNMGKGGGNNKIHWEIRVDRHMKANPYAYKQTYMHMYTHKPLLPTETCAPPSFRSCM